MSVNKLTKKRICRAIIGLFCIFFIALSVVPPIINTLADQTDDQGEALIKQKYAKFAKGASSTAEVAGKFSNYGMTNETNSFRYIWGRLFSPGYLDNVTKYVAAKGSDTSMITDSGGQKYLCNPNAPANLVGYNCDLPNISAEILQSLIRVLLPNGITGGQRQSAEPALKLGIPKGIPGKAVPVVDSDKHAKYTALELFGYNMNWTTYNGEWDDIIPSTRARLLANYGSLDKINLTGQSIWNGISTGISSYIHNTKLTNPLTWFSSVSKAWTSGTSASVLTVLDSSDANIATTHQWVRSGNSVSDSFYRVYTLSDKQVVSAGTARATKSLVTVLNKLAGKSKPTKEMISFEAAPTGYQYDKNKTTAAYNKKKSKIEAYNKKQKDSSKKKAIPTPTAKDYMTDKEQLAAWMKTNKEVQAAKKVGIKIDSPTDYTDFKTKWAAAYQNALQSFMNNSSKSSTVSKLIDKAVNKVMKNDPYANPQTAISHYVCAHKDGSPYINSEGNYVYLYTRNNDGTREYLNNACSANLPIRPTIQGGYFGDGYANSTITDTRNVANNNYSLINLIPFVGDLDTGIQTLNGFLTKMIAQIVNEMLNLSFSPLLKQLGITTITKVAFNDFAKSIFFPLMTIVIMVGALFTFIDVIRTKSLRRFITTFIVMFLVLISAFVIFKHPGEIIDKTEEVPLTVDNSISNLLLKGNQGTTMCAASGSNTDGVREAQCYVWKDIIFNTWTYGQFGTSYKNLYPNTPNGNKHQSHMTNSNTDLVGDPAVDFGNRNYLSNWALYQMYLMTSGTITTPDSSRPVGSQDNNLYRLVDLQAGPKNAVASDTRYWSAWRGQDGNRTWISFLGLLLAGLAFVSIGGLLVTKIELTFLMSIMLLGFPIMLLFALTQKGQLKLKGYLATMLGLFLKRELIVVLLCTLLKVWDFSINTGSGSFTTVFVAAATVLLFFIIYKPEILKLFHFDTEDLFAGEGLFSGDPDAVKNVVQKHTPTYLRNKIYMASAKVKGVASGAVGGALGGAMAARDAIKRNEDKDFINPEKLTRAAKLGRVMSVAGKSALRGSTDALRFQQRRADNFLTRNGLSKIEQFGRANQAVNKKAQDKMLNDQNKLGELYREASNRSKYGNKLANNSAFSGKNLEMIKNDPKLMALLNKQQKLAEKAIQKAKKGQGIAAHMSNESDKLSKIEKSIDSSMKKAARTDRFRHPIASMKHSGSVVNLKDQAQQKASPIDKTAAERAATLNSIKNKKQEHAEETNDSKENLKKQVFQQSSDSKGDSQEQQQSTNTTTDKKSNLAKEELVNNLNNQRNSSTTENSTQDTDTNQQTKQQANSNTTKGTSKDKNVQTKDDKSKKNDLAEHNVLHKSTAVKNATIALNKQMAKKNAEENEKLNADDSTTKNQTTTTTTGEDERPSSPRTPIYHKLSNRINNEVIKSDNSTSSSSNNSPKPDSKPNKLDTKKPKSNDISTDTKKMLLGKLNGRKVKFDKDSFRKSQINKLRGGLNKNQKGPKSTSELKKEVKRKAMRRLHFDKNKGDDNSVNKKDK